MLSDIEAKEIALQLRDSDAVNAGFQKFIYTGKCMAPLLTEGDEMLIRRVPYDKLCLGDIIIYKDRERFMVHRFLYKKLAKDNSSHIITKADNFSERDKPFKAEDFLGRVVEINRAGEHLVLEKRPWPIISRFMGAASLMEALTFEGICFVKLRFFKWLKVRKGLKQKMAEIVRMPKSFLSKALYGKHR